MQINLDTENSDERGYIWKNARGSWNHRIFARQFSINLQLQFTICTLQFAFFFISSPPLHIAPFPVNTMRIVFRKITISSTKLLFLM